ncbi:MAG: GNAT family N-acetyltransferase, partial [Spirochaetes bacterium]|nr:GNAT family N-acetyltransferase [Spirochaetota bacterium]
KEIKTAAALAKKIWNDHYVSIIGQKQVDYMLEKFQSEEAISSQIDSGYEYYLLLNDNIPAAYLAILPDYPHEEILISKIYVDTSARGKGLGLHLIEFVKNQSKERKIRKIRLTVNRHNSISIGWYKKRGFAVTDEVKQDIGGGFYMDDFIMEMIILD